MTREYTVTWTIQVDADSPEQAARIAGDIQRDPESTATIFHVTDETGANCIVVDNAGTRCPVCDFVAAENLAGRCIACGERSEEAS